MEQTKNISINLINEYAPWDKVVKEAYSLWMRGYAFIDEQYYSGDALVRYVSDCLDEAPTEERISILKDLIPQLNGAWALAYETDSVVLAAVDRLRSIPLFYAMEDGKVLLSDDAREVLKCLSNADLDDICAAEFLVAGYVTGKDTLYKGLYQTQPGEILEVKIPKDASPKISTHRYYRFIFGNYFEADEQELEEELSKLWHQIFSRYAIALKGKTPVIPLSGGLDSRLIAAMFKRCGVENVICFSYGRHGNAEAEASRAVANALGYKWLFCPYDEPSWYKWFREERMREYIDYGSNYSSLAHIQDWPVTGKILNDNLDDEVAFMPGHSLDLLAGSHIPDELFNAKENITYDTLVPEAVLSHHYSLWPWRNVCPNLKDVFVERIRKVLPAFVDSDKSEAIGAYETWDVESRQVLFIINSARVYEFFGCHWMLPWWDYELMDFFLRVQVNLRFQKRLYRNTLLHKIFVDELSELASIPVVGLPLTGLGIQKAKHQPLLSFVYRGLMNIVPDFVKAILAYYLKNDHLAMHGRYERFPKHFGKFSSIYPFSINNIPPSVKRILQPNMDKFIITLSVNGPQAAQQIGFLASQE